MSRRIHGEDFESGRRHARYVHVLFHRNVPRGIEGIYIYIIPSSHKSGPSEDSSSILCVVLRASSNYYQRFRPFLTSILKFVENPVFLPFPSPRKLSLSRWKNANSIFTIHKKIYIKKRETNGNGIKLRNDNCAFLSAKREIYYRLSKRKRNKWRINLGKWSRFAPEERISDPTKDTRSQSWRDEDVNVKADRAIVNAILDFPPFFGGCWRVKLEPL